MVRTRVGYAGGTTESPSYHRLGDHTETIQVDYDPRQITFDQLLGVFWDGHDPTCRSRSRQYMAIVFFQDETQRQQALASKRAREQKLGREVHTEIRPATSFHLAEDYHQKYRLRQHREIAREYEAIYPALKDFVDSTAAARVNGYLAGYGTAGQLEREIDELGLSEAARRRLEEIWQRHRPR